MIIRLHPAADEHCILYTVNLPSPADFPEPCSLPASYAAQLRALNVFTLPVPPHDGLMALDHAAGTVARTHEISFFLESKLIEVVGIDGTKETKEMTDACAELLKTVLKDVNEQDEKVSEPEPEKKKDTSTPKKKAEEAKPKPTRQKSRNFLKTLVISLCRSPSSPLPSPTLPAPVPTAAPPTALSIPQFMPTKMRRRRARATLVDAVSLHVLPLLKFRGGYPAWAASREIQRVEASMRFLECEAGRTEDEMIACVRDMNDTASSSFYGEEASSIRPRRAFEQDADPMDDDSPLSTPELEEDTSSGESGFSTLQTPESTMTSLSSPFMPPMPSPSDLEAYAELTSRAAVLRNTLRHFLTCSAAARRCLEPAQESDDRSKKRAWLRRDICVSVGEHDKYRWTRPARSSSLAQYCSWPAEESSSPSIEISEARHDTLSLSGLQEAMEDSIHNVPSNVSPDSDSSDEEFPFHTPSMPKLPTLDFNALKPATEWAAKRLASGKGVFVDDDPFADVTDEELSDVSQIQIHVGDMVFGVEGLPVGPTVLKPKLGRNGLTWLPCIAVEV